MPSDNPTTNEMHTTCLHCGSVFRISTEQLDMAYCQVRFSQCQQTFNALLTLESPLEESQPLQHANEPTAAEAIADLFEHSQAAADPEPAEDPDSVSLNEAMYGEGRAPRSAFRQMLWFAGIVTLLVISLVQVVYYQRYQLISSSQFQPQILSLCQLLPCDEDRFNSLPEIELIERNVYTHPTRDNALMITGSFINKADFSQPIPSLLISLSDIQGNLIANRLFEPTEFLANASQQRIESKKAVSFRLEILDPGNTALTYEFEFVQ